MAKLTMSDRKKIVAEYSTGEYTKTALAKKYGCSPQAIADVIKHDPDYLQKLEERKKEVEKDLSDRVMAGLGAQTSDLLDVSRRAVKRLQEAMDTASVRDAAGALKIAYDALMSTLDRHDAARIAGHGEPVQLHITVADCSGSGAEHGTDQNGEVHG